MSTPKSSSKNESRVLRRPHYERFFSDSFLLNRGKVTFERIVNVISRHLISTSAQLFVFGGGLGLIWVLSHLEPHGDLSLYLLPITILAMPIAVVAPNDHWAERLINGLFLLPFVGFFLWSFAWYFLHHEWGYDARWLALEGVCVFSLIYFCVKRSLRIPQGPQRSLIRRIWLFGIGICWGSLGFLGYYIGTQSTPEHGTSNLLAGGSFILFLTILIIRVFWLDSIRARRANRAEFTPPPDHIILFEWLVPRSFNFALTLVMLLIAQAMMFSTIYRASQQKLHDRLLHLVSPEYELTQRSSQPSAHSTARRPMKSTPVFSEMSERSPLTSRSTPSSSQNHHLQSLSRSGSMSHTHLASKEDNQSSARGQAGLSEIIPPLIHPSKNASVMSSNQRSSNLGVSQSDLLEHMLDQGLSNQIKPDVKLSAWVFFSFKPYVFPKDDQAREISAPLWFKYLGRALIGLIIAILLTKQLNILETDHGLLLDSPRSESRREAIWL